MELLPFSVLLSVYFKESALYLDAAFESIWDNQSLKPDQIVLVKDGKLSSELDATISMWSEKLGPVLTVVELKENVGLATALNAGLDYCDYELVARMDTDDISLSERFYKQVSFMTHNRDVSVCGAIVEEWDERCLVRLSIRNLPSCHEGIMKFAKRRCPVSHPVVIFRKEAVISSGGYPVVYPEDYPLWIMMLSRGYKFYNVPEVLLRMRAGDEMLCRRGWGFFLGETKVFYLMWKLGFTGSFDFFCNVLTRGVVRLSPRFIKVLLYKFAR
ncbi:glycosyltransferase [Onishia taeanensis]|nr:glycosyltransferase [Halomonas taeanensis]